MTAATAETAPRNARPLASAPPAPETPLAVTVPRATLLDIVRHAAAVVGPRPAVPVLAGVLLSNDRGVLTATGYDYERLHQSAAVAAGGRGAVLAPARDLRTMVAALDRGCDVTLRTDGEALTITGAGVTYRVPKLPLADYPAIPEDRGARVAELPAPALERLARACAAAGWDEGLPVLTAVRLTAPDGKLIATATDRYRLLVAETDVEADKATDMLVPRQMLALAARTFRKGGADLWHHDGDSRAVFERGGKLIGGRMIDGEYPKTASLFPPEYEAEVLVDSAVLAVAVRQVSVVEAGGPVQLHVSPDSIEIVAGQDDLRNARKRIPAEGAGVDRLSVALNPDYLLDGLNAVGGERARLAFTKPSKPVVVSGPTDQAVRYLLMPVWVAAS